MSNVSNIELHNIQRPADSYATTTSSSSNSKDASALTHTHEASSSKSLHHVNSSKSKSLGVSYSDYLDRLVKAWPDMPDVHISYSRLTYSLQIPYNDTSIPSMPRAFANMFRSLAFQKSPSYTLNAIQNLNGVVRPGEMTLILAPPGHGKSVFLKALSGRLGNDVKLSGDLTYNGLTYSEALAKSIYINKLTAFVNQRDAHFAHLTVRETLQFALDNSVADPALLNDPQLVSLHKKKVELMLDLLGLKECADTIAGDAMARGISGGQKKRLTLGEMLITNARALMLDEVTTGLDAAAAYDIFVALKQWTRTTRGSVVTALLQPTPEMVATFDNIILLHQGEMVYNGKREDLIPYLASLGVRVPVDEDLADFLVDLLSDPYSILMKQLESDSSDSDAENNNNSPMPPAKNHYHPDHHDEKLQEEDHYSVDPRIKQIGEDQDPELPPVTIHYNQADFDHVTPQPQSQPRSNDVDVEEDVNVNTELQVKVLGENDDNPIPPPSKLTQQQSVDSFINVPIERIPIAPKSESDLLGLAYESGFANQWNSSDLAQELNREISKKLRDSTTHPLVLKSEYSRVQFGQLFSHSFLRHFGLIFNRQKTLLARNKLIAIPRIASAIFMGLVLGSLYWQISNYSTRLGLCLFVLIFAAFGNMAEMPQLDEAKPVLYKQVDSGFYPSLSYVLSVVLFSFPLAFAESAVFGILIYFMTGFTLDAGRFFFFLLTLAGNSLTFSTVFRTFGYLAPNEFVAQQMAGPYTAISLLFGGFLITKDQVPNYFIWLYWISPFSWTVRTLALNEFNDGKYSGLVPVADSNTSIRQGDSDLNIWHIDTDTAWKWAGFGFSIGWFMVFAAISYLVLTYKRSELSLGTKRPAPPKEKEGENNTNRNHHNNHNNNNNNNKSKANTNTVAIDIKKANAVKGGGAPASSSASVLPFIPLSLTWSNIKYTVTLEDGKTQRVLLTDVNGYCKPGELTALMGSSGAGKTTLMDVIAGRKTAGVIEGKMMVNGVPKEPKTFARLMGYVEQNDLHMPFATLRESLLFSARLRLPASVPDHQRIAFVDELIELLELGDIQNRIIGSEDFPSLSPGQLKLVTIATELCANPTFLFLDEPTSGLDSRTALNVMRVVRKIVNTGRTVLCTIHQPSAEVFFMFDRLLLLKSGGSEVYFGDVGHKGRSLRSYFQHHGSSKFPRNINPATYMLDVIGAGTHGSAHQDWTPIYKKSKEYTVNMRTIEQLDKEGAQSKNNASVAKVFASVSMLYQFVQVFTRELRTYWRNTSYNFIRMCLLTVLGIIFGLSFFRTSHKSFSGVQTTISSAYMSAAFCGVINAATALPVLLRDRAVYYRERASNSYGPTVYGISISLVELPYIFINCLLFAISFYYLADFKDDGTTFFRFLLAFYILSLCFNGLTGVLSALLPNAMAANQLQGLVFTFLFLFGGVFIQADSIPAGWKWVYYMNPVPKALGAMILPQFECPSGTVDYKCDPYIQINVGATVKNESSAQFVTDYLSMGYDSYASNIGWMILTIFVIRLLYVLCLRISHIKR